MSRHSSKYSTNASLESKEPENRATSASYIVARNVGAREGVSKPRSAAAAPFLMFARTFPSGFDKFN